MTTKSKTKKKAVKAWAVFDDNKIIRLMTIRQNQKESIQSFVDIYGLQWIMYSSCGYRCLPVEICVIEKGRRK